MLGECVACFVFDVKRILRSVGGECCLSSFKGTTPSDWVAWSVQRAEGCESHVEFTDNKEPLKNIKKNPWHRLV